MFALTPYPITPIGNFIGVVLALIPLLSTTRRKLGAGFALWGYAIWIAIYNFTMFVNTIIWHHNVNIVVPVWCDIATKLQLGSTIGTRACTLVICTHLYKMTHINRPFHNKRNVMIFELLLIIGLPVVVMALWIVAQPIRFLIEEEFGCSNTVYSFVGYIIEFAPQLICNAACLILAILILQSRLKSRSGIKEFQASGWGMEHQKYYRFMIIAFLDTAFNLPVLIILLVTSIAEGDQNFLNFSYVSWENVHDGAGGNIPGSSLSTILQMPASDWSIDKWTVFTLKWDEWLFVLHAVTFFCVFGTTPEMRRHYGNVFWYIPECLGYKRPEPPSDKEMLPDIAFRSNPAQRGRDRPTANRRRDPLSFTETTINSASATHSGTASGVGATTNTHLDIETINIEEGNEYDESRGE